MSDKVRYTQRHHDEWLAAIIGMTMEQVGLFNVVCDFIASTGRPIEEDDERLMRIFKNKRNKVKRVLGELVAIGKLSRNGPLIDQLRTANELAMTRERIANYPQTQSQRKDRGPVSNKINKVTPDTRAQTTNHKPLTTNHNAGERSPASPLDRGGGSPPAQPNGNLSPEERAAFDRLRADTIKRFAIIPDQPQTIEERQALVDQWTKELADTNDNAQPQPTPIATPIATPDAKPQ